MRARVALQVSHCSSGSHVIAVMCSDLVFGIKLHVFLQDTLIRKTYVLDDENNLFSPRLQRNISYISFNTITGRFASPDTVSLPFAYSSTRGGFISIVFGMVCV